MRPIPDLAVGDRVTHDAHGVGKVLTVDGADYVTVDFGNDKIRRIPLNSPALYKI